MALDVHLRGARVASLRRKRRGYSLAYDTDAVERLGEDRARISLALPPRSKPYGREETRVYVEGLLPRGARRRRLAHELGVDPADGYALIAELGSDCPGAVTFLGEGEEAGPRAPEELAWLSEDELAEALEWPPERCFDPDEPRRMRFTLPGERHKAGAGARRGVRPLGLAGGGRPEHPRGDPRIRPASRNGAQRARLLQRGAGAGAAGRRLDGRGARRPQLPGRASLRPLGRGRGDRTAAPGELPAGDRDRPRRGAGERRGAGARPRSAVQDRGRRFRRDLLLGRLLRLGARRPRRAPRRQAGADARRERAAAGPLLRHLLRGRLPRGRKGAADGDSPNAARRSSPPASARSA